MLPGWVPLSKVAADAGVDPKTMRRRLLALDHAAGGGLVRSFHRRGKPRKYWVRLDRLKVALEHTPEETQEAQVEWLEARVQKVENRVEALKNAHKSLKALVKERLPAP